MCINAATDFKSEFLTSKQRTKNKALINICTKMSVFLLCPINCDKYTHIPGRDADHSPPSSAEVKKELSYTSTYPMGPPGPVTRLTLPLLLLHGANMKKHTRSFHHNEKRHDFRTHLL